MSNTKNNETLYKVEVGGTTYEIIPRQLSDGTYVYPLPAGLNGEENLMLSVDPLVIPEIIDKQGGYTLTFIQRGGTIYPYWTPKGDIVYANDNASDLGLGEIVFYNNDEYKNAPCVVYYDVPIRITTNSFDPSVTYGITVSRSLESNHADTATNATNAEYAVSASSATNAENATHASTADSATTATTAGTATSATTATNATYAQYASDDTSKGTIEERLTSLGFRQGSFISADSSTYLLGAETNIIKKQGKYVIATLVNPYVYTESDPSSSFPASFEAVLIPEGFRPKSVTYVSCFGQQLMALDTYCTDCKINTDGTIETVGGTGFVLRTMVSVGWEID